MPSAPPRELPFVLSHEDASDLRLKGRLTLPDAGALWRELRGHVAELAQGAALNFDMEQVETVDGGALALLVHVRSDLRLRGVECEFINANPRIHDLVHLYRGDVDPKP